MMGTNHIFTVDTQVMGEPLRMVTGGISYIKGRSIQEKMAYFELNFDHIRSGLMLEPRGHDNMFGAVLCEPIHPEADVGIFFMHAGGYLNMCGHGTIGVVTAMLEMGIVDKEKEETVEVVLETPVGLVTATTQIENNKVQLVSFENVPSFVLYSDLEVNLPGVGAISVDISYGGNFFGIVSAKELNTEIGIGKLPKLVSESMRLRDLLNEQLEIAHPFEKHINRVDLIEVYEHVAGENPRHKNCVVFGNGQIDRSPCGSGTCAMMAVMYHKRELGLNENFFNDSVIDTSFSGKVVGETKVGEYDAVIPVVSGKAYITGVHHFIIDSDDPLAEGFSVNSF